MVTRGAADAGAGGLEAAVGHRIATSVNPKDPAIAPAQIQRAGKATARTARSSVQAARPRSRLTAVA